ncbi:hypothetical protein BKA62DRAFT_720806 [Auriculariales sp. MPI-PUGE-AT-0066]|nr:hypothetical protein BKA62DRAFT_720806 [Auriculariales sp. MPI-PUGE-AT-0066]
MASPMERALKREISLVYGLAARQADSNDQCIQNCLYQSIPYALDLCGLELSCMCGNSNFRTYVHQCMSAVCGFSSAADEANLDNILDRCVAGLFDPTSSSSIPTITTATIVGPTFTTITITSTTPKTTTQTYVPTPTPSPKSDSGGVNIGVIAGAAVGGIVVLAALGALAWWCVRRNKRRATPAYIPPAPRPMGETKTPIHHFSPVYNQGTSSYAPSSSGSPPPPAHSNFAGQQPLTINTTPELGYVPPSHFSQYGTIAGVGAGAAAPSHTFSSTSITTGSSGPLGGQSQSPVSPTSNPGAAGGGSANPAIGGFNPYVLNPQHPQGAPPTYHT